MPTATHYGLPQRGQTYYKGGTVPSGTSTYTQESINLEGSRQVFKDVVVSTSATGAKQRRTNKDVVCELVRNSSGISLLGGRAVTYAAGYLNRRVDGYCTTNYQRVAGITDEHLGSSGVAAHDLFWIVISGPTLVKTPLEGDATNVWSEGTRLVALTAATSQCTTSGRLQPYEETSSVTVAQQQLLNIIGTAISAKTTANTNADALIDVELIKTK